jgi:hypothetical protein
MDVMVGLSIGQRRDPSALCVVEIDERLREDGRHLDHFLVRHLERLPVATERYGAFQVGRHDDLVTALGLAVQEKPGRWVLQTLALD